MRISLIGMSGIGKSYWSKKLAHMGFTRFGCDDLIEEQLAPELQALGYSGIHDMAKWLGQPYEPQYAVNSQKYLYQEQKTLDDILNQIETSSINDDIVIDTTGSVIYLADGTQKKLKQLTTVVYLSVSEAVKTQMYQLYFHHPKPVMWGDMFSPLPGESSLQTLQRCYLELLDYRREKICGVSRYYLRLRYFTVPKILASNNG